MLKLAFILGALPSLVFAAFTTHDQACWRRNCIVRTDAGTLCFEPQENGIYQGECTDGFLKNLTGTHLDSTVGRSIVYYDDKARFLGAATWSIPPSMSDPVFVCMSGRRMDDPKKYRTICRRADGDDDMHSAAVHAVECVVDKKPRLNNDGCFNLGGKHADNDDKNFWEQPVVGGVFWALGSLLTVAAIGRWGRKAIQRVQDSFPRLVELLVRGFDFVTSHWRTKRTHLAARGDPFAVIGLPQYTASLPARPVNALLSDERVPS